MTEPRPPDRTRAQLRRRLERARSLVITVLAVALLVGAAAQLLMWTLGIAPGQMR